MKPRTKLDSLHHKAVVKSQIGGANAYEKIGDAAAICSADLCGM